MKVPQTNLSHSISVCKQLTKTFTKHPTISDCPHHIKFSTAKPVGVIYLLLKGTKTIQSSDLVTSMRIKYVCYVEMVTCQSTSICVMCVCVVTNQQYSLSPLGVHQRQAPPARNTAAGLETSTTTGQGLHCAVNG